MEIQDAIKIVRALAGGTHPETSKGLSADSICRIPQVTRALNRALAALVQQEQRERRRPSHAGHSWSHDEDAQLCAEIRKGIDFHEIAKTHNRSLGSIVARLVKLGEIKPAARASEAA
jgi:hypothetical protein